MAPDPASLADSFASLTRSEQIEWLCRSSMQAWSSLKRHFENAPFHEEWYQIAQTASRACVVAPREHAKTEVFTVNATAWRSIYQAGTWTYVFAATLDQAKGLKERIDAAVLEVEPFLVENARTKTTTTTVFANGSRVTVAGQGKAVRSAHPDVIVGDDVLEEDSAISSTGREKTNRWWLGTVTGMTHPGVWRLVSGQRRWFPPTRVFLVGTPFHRSDLLLSMKENPLYHFRRYAAEFAPGDLVPGTFAVEVAGASADSRASVPVV